jgi:hypothetical protein
MVNIGRKLSDQWKDAVNLVLGLWLIVSPWALGLIGNRAPTWNAWAFGLVIAAAALAALISFKVWEEWVEAALGAWLIVSPFLLGFSALTYALWNQVIVGVIVAALAVWSALAMPGTAGRALR